MRGEGRTFRRGQRWWIAFYVAGREQREAASTKDADGLARPATSERDALKALHARRRQVLGGHFHGLEQERVTVGDLLDDMVLHLRNRGRRSVDQLVSHIKPVRAFFAHRRAADVTTPLVERYIEERLAAGRARATVNRELEGLRRAFNLAYRHTPPRVTRVPYIPLLDVDNARQGFVSVEAFRAILAALPDEDLRDFISWSFWTGMRPSETSRLSWDGFDRETWTLTLAARDTKTGHGRVIALEGPLREILQRRIQARRLGCPLIFHRTRKGRGGQPVKDYRRAWASACQAAGLKAGRSAAGGVTPYDLRRSAVRNLVRAGVHETVVMAISGHRTRSTFDRYNIVSVDDVRTAITRVATLLNAPPPLHR